MSKNRILTLVWLFVFIIFGFLGGFLVWRKRGIPFVRSKEQWSIGIYRGKTPFSFENPLNWLNPIFEAEYVTDVPAKFVADPFLIRDGDTWDLFFEVYNDSTKQGDLALAQSKNTWKWNYRGIIIDEPFHLSYPYVFKWDDNYYLIPESFEANSIRLYKADIYPLKWSFVKTLVAGKDYVDNSIVYYDGKWWLFSSTTGNDTLYLFYADEPTGPWLEHPKSPIVVGNNHKARPCGRLIVYENRLYRYTMDINPSVGTHEIFAYEITNITPTDYSEKMASENPILKASGSGWNKQAMHQIDPVQIASDQWIASVDGFGKYLIFGWNY